MKLLGSILFLLISFIQLTAQYNRSNKKYRNKFDFQLDEGEKIKKTWYHYVVTELNDTFRVRVFHPDKYVLTQIVHFTDKKMRKANGKNTVFLDDGSLFESGELRDGVKIGHWKEWDYTAGFDEGQYINGLKEGMWVKKDVDGNTAASFNYLGGRKNGSYEFYDSLGNVTESGYYENDSLLSQIPSNSKEESMPTLKVCSSIADMDIDECSKNILLNHFYKSLTYPKVARKMELEGKALFQFVIDDEGNVIDIITLSGICKEIEASCKEVFKNMPEWNPGYQEGEAVKVLYTIPIVFKLE